MRKKRNKRRNKNRQKVNQSSRKDVVKQDTDAAEKAELADVIADDVAKKHDNDQWSVEEIEKNVEELEKNDHGSVKPEIIEIDVDSVDKRRRGKSWIWWVIGILIMMLVAGGVCWAAVSNDDASQQNDDTTAKTEEGDGKVDEPEESEGSEGEPEAVPKEKDEPVEKDPVKEEPPAQQPAPIAPRPKAPQDLPYVEAGSKLVALTFDDGPSAVTTPRLLDILKTYDVKATFFALGTMAQRSPDILRREKAEGHEVASHTMYHNQLTKLSFADVRGEAAEMDRIFTEILGQVPAFTRPPYGSYNVTVGDALGQPMVLWSVDPRDWADRNASVVCNRVLSSTVDGSIVLVHDIYSTTVDAVPCIIDGLKARGFKFLTVSELARVRGVSMVNGQAYFSF